MVTVVLQHTDHSGWFRLPYVTEGGPALDQDGRLVDWGCAMNFVTIVVCGVVVVAYVVGCLTSSVETETQLPHNYR